MGLIMEGLTEEQLQKALIAALRRCHVASRELQNVAEGLRTIINEERGGTSLISTLSDVHEIQGRIGGIIGGISRELGEVTYNHYEGTKSTGVDDDISIHGLKPEK